MPDRGPKSSNRRACFFFLEQGDFGEAVAEGASCRLACLVLWWQDPNIAASTYKSHIQDHIAYQTREVVRPEPR